MTPRRNEAPRDPQANQARADIARAMRATRELHKADRLAESGCVEEALRSVRLALQLGADRYTCLLKMVRLYKSRQQWEEAVSAAETAVAEHPDKLTAREALIALLMETRDYTRAISASKELLKLWPRHIPVRDALGAAYIGLGDVHSAMRVANELIRTDPTSPAHHFTKALLCQHMGEVAMAVQEFERVLGMSDDPDLLDSSRAQLDAIDAFQLEQILTLGAEDGIFRAKLTRAPELAIIERGFALSTEGLQRLADAVGDGMLEADPYWNLNQYH